MQKLLIPLLAGLTLGGCRADAASPPDLASGGKTTFVIAVAADAIPAEKTAASELQKYLQQVTGSAFAVKQESEVASEAPQILVGAGPRVKALLPQQNWDALRHDGIVIKTVGNKLVLAGGRPRGSLYAVYQYLEDSVGCRWWTATESAIPKRSTLPFPNENVVYVPPFDYREHFTRQVQEDPIFATIMRENGHFQKQSSEWGGHYNILGWCHTFSQLLPPATYFKAHPEWYSDPRNGYLPCTAKSQMPNNDEQQLCLSNPAVVDELTKNALAWIAKNPEAGYISIAQNDSRNSFCQCPECRKLQEQEGSPSGPLIRFVNEVAVRIGAKYPDFLVETLAYQATEVPPKTMRPAKNVIIRFAPIESDFGHPLDSDANAPVREHIEGWSKLATNLFAWNYVTNFDAYWRPHPNWGGLGPDLRFFAANKVKGVFEQGDPYSKGMGDFVQLRAWLMSKLLWNPALDQKTLTDEFMRGYYGDAAPALQSYLDLLQASFEKQKTPLLEANTDFAFLTLDVMNQSSRLFDQAEAAVKDNPQILFRVQRERLLVDLSWAYRYRKLKQEAAASGKAFLGPSDPQKFLAALPETAQKFGDDIFMKDGDFPKVIPRLESTFAPPAELPEFAKGTPAGDVFDFQQNGFYLYRLGDLTSVVDDATASDGKAAKMQGNTGDWAVQAPLSWLMEGAESGTYHVYAYVRSPLAADTTGPGVVAGIYDKSVKKSLIETTVPLQDIAGDQFVRLDLGIQPLSNQSYIYFASVPNPAVSSVFVDRVILIRQR